MFVLFAIGHGWGGRGGRWHKESRKIMTPISSPPAEADSRTWPAALVVVAIAAFFAWGLPVLNARLPATSEQPGGVLVDLGQGVSVVTPAGWSADLAKTKPKDTLALSRDTSSLVATAFPWTGSEAELVERTRNLLEGVAHFAVRRTPTPMRTGQGFAGTTYAFFGEHVEGRVWVGILPGGKNGFAVRVRSVAGQGDSALRDAQAVVDSLQWRETP